MNWLRPLALLAALAAVSGGARSADAQGDFREEFEGPDTSWREAGADTRYRLEAHARSSDAPHSGRGCERLRINAANGTYVYLAHDVGQARVIAELQLAAWVKADRPGVQLLAQVVLPRTMDPRTGQAMSVVIRGSGYTRVGSWQLLQLDNFPLLVEREARVLRAQRRGEVDTREAYVSRAVLNVYGGPGATSVSIDDLTLDGVVPRQPAARVSDTSFDRAQIAPSRPVGWNPPRGSAAGPQITLSGTTLAVDGQRIFPRIVEYRGESLARLQSLGFAAVLIDDAATPELLAEAARLGMWLIAAPPKAGQSTEPAIGPEFARVLAWNLGRDLAPADLEATRQLSHAVRAADPLERPTLCETRSNVRGFSRQADILLAWRAAPGSSWELNDFSRWLRQRPQLARPGSTWWATLPSRCAPQVAEQAAALRSDVGPLLVGEESLRQAAHAALAAGARGICVNSTRPLDGADAETRQIAAVWELLNLELEMLAPWAAAGNPATAASGSDPNTLGLVLQTERTRLLLPMPTARHGQLVSGGFPSTGATFVVPGVPDSNDAYLLSPVELRPLTRRATAGGTRVTIPGGEYQAVVFTQDPAALRELARRIAAGKGRAAALRREVSAAHWQRTARMLAELTSVGQALPECSARLAEARALLVQAESLAAQNEAMAYHAARRASLALAEVERTQWQRAAQASGPPGSHPLAVLPATLPAFWQWQAQATAPAGANRLPAGDFEDLQTALRMGWRHLQHAEEGIETEVSLAPAAAHGGKLGLKLSARATDPRRAPLAVENAPLWVTSPSVELRPGDTVAIRGWARLAEPVAGSVDGLMVVDSIGGEPLAVRLCEAGPWQAFRLLRTAPRGGPLSVTVALSGLGEAWIDDLTIEVLSPKPSP